MFGDPAFDFIGQMLARSANHTLDFPLHIAMTRLCHRIENAVQKAARLVVDGIGSRTGGTVVVHAGGYRALRNQLETKSSHVA